MSSLQLYLGDDDHNIQYTPPSAWADNSSVSWTNGNSRVPNQSQPATLQFTFVGTAAIFHGASFNDGMFTPIIDDVSQPSQTLPGTLHAPSYGAWYRTPNLQQGQHTVVIHDVPAVMLDFIVLEVDPATTFPQTTPVIVSDSDPSIKYSGSWRQDSDGRWQTLQPFHFVGDYSTRSSCRPGDTISVPFSRSSITLWGTFDWITNGLVAATYSIDGNQPEEVEHQAGSMADLGVQPNFLLFKATDLSNGPHTLLVTVTSCSPGQGFVLDYITYTPPSAAGPDSSSPIASAITTSSTLFRPTTPTATTRSMTSTTTTGTTSPGKWASTRSSTTTRPTTSTATTSTTSSGQGAPTPSSATTGQAVNPSHFPLGTIAGIIIGVVGLAAAGVTLWYYFSRRKIMTMPFPRSSSSIAITRKTAIPPHIRQTRSTPSHGSTHTGNQPGTHNIREPVAEFDPPPYSPVLGS